MMCKGGMGTQGIRYDIKGGGRGTQGIRYGM